jgi:hypothetical protein
VIGEGGNKVLGYSVDAVDVSLSCIIIDGCARSTITSGLSFFKADFLGAIARAHTALPGVN